MTFYIDKIILWLKNGHKRMIMFENDKVNIITGNSKTGKTAILEIIDYCLCGSESNISSEHIGENILWYGLRFYINGKYYTIARGEYKETLSKSYFFSSTGEIPDMPYTTISESDIKYIIESEFSINSNVSFSYGGKSIKQNTKISFRYFLLFNTLSGDVIAHSKNYFDKMDIDRYREALPRIFDLALGITTLENSALQDQIDRISSEINKLENQKRDLIDKEENRNSELKLIIKQAKEEKIISSDISDFNECIKLLTDIFETGELPILDIGNNDKLNELLLKKQEIEIQIRKLNKFKNKYSEYKKNLEKEAEALSPIKYIYDNFSSNIENDEYKHFLLILDSELEKIKVEISHKKPFEHDVDDKIKTLKNDLKNIQFEINNTPLIDNKIKDISQRLISVGEIKSKFYNLTKQTFDIDQIGFNLKDKEQLKAELESKYIPTEENRKNVINALNDYVQTYINIAEKALDEYGKYLASFEYNKKVLKLRKNKSTTTANITSSSDHLFMHLCLFLGMHQLIMDNQVPYILPFLIMDQPSRPYFNNSDFDFNKSKESLTSKDDWIKVKEIFALLNKYMENIKKDNHHFQIIIMEHVSESAWQDCGNINLIETFDGIDNALIPSSEEF